MSAKDFFSKGWPTRLAFYLGKYSPPRGGRLIAGLAARTLVTLKPDIYHVVYDNQTHVLGAEATETQIKESVYHVFFNAARAYYELFHNVGRGRTEVKSFDPPVRLMPEAKVYLEEALATGRGVFILGCHTSNFDLAGIALGQFISRPLQVLSMPDPPGGFELFNRLRKQAGTLLTPISPGALRDAMRRLSSGGAVITGVDRPSGEGDEPAEFFGATAKLPTGYIRIPLRTGCLVMTACPFLEDGEYRIVANPPMEMQQTGDRRRDIKYNHQRVLRQVEALIRRHPDQWMMFVPVWDNACTNTCDNIDGKNHAKA
ncbi:MAG: lysophospholipid acyltransferase family protein [Anaerolineae bacterium]